MIDLVVSGASGRLGRLILLGALKDPQIRVVGAIVRRGSSAEGQPISTFLGVSDTHVVATSQTNAIVPKSVVIETAPKSAVFAHIERASNVGAPVIVATTGFDEREKKAILAYRTKIPVLVAANLSLGAHVLFELVERASSALLDFDVEILEIHHNQKRDAPSGTAWALADAAARGRRLDAKKNAIVARSGMIGPRGRDEIGVFALRGGDVVGEHTVHFLGHAERLELVHRAQSRDVFAKGAIAAARFLGVPGRKPGEYTMRDVLLGGAIGAETMVGRVSPKAAPNLEGATVSEEEQRTAASTIAVSKLLMEDFRAWQKSKAKNGEPYVIGLGTGKAAAVAVEAVGKLFREGKLGKDVQCIPTSERTREQAERLGLPVLPHTTKKKSRIAIDGADEVWRAPNGMLVLIKGGGGAMYRERKVDEKAAMFVVVVEERKVVDVLGARFPLPVEVEPTAWQATKKAVEALGCVCTRRKTANGTAPFETDQKNFILDCAFPHGFAEPVKLAKKLEATAGVFAHGLFIGTASVVVVGKSTGEVEFLRPGATKVQ